MLDRARELTLGVINGIRYARCVIRSLRDRETEKVFARERSRRLPPDVQRRGIVGFFVIGLFALNLILLNRGVGIRE